MLSLSVRSLFGNHGFYNVGDWSAGAQSAFDACRRLVERHLDLLEDLPRRTLLDIGCGLGEGTAIAAERHPEAALLGINLSLRQLAHADRRPRYAAMDATRLAIATQSIDGAISVEAALHFRSRRHFLAELARILRPGGVVVLSDVYFRSRNWAGAWSVSAEPFDRDALARTLHDTGFAIDSLEDITAATWQPFADYVERSGIPALASSLRAAGATYVLTRFRRR
ncbi:MAG TPA: methyltransferase domain-containing protein [Thermoanaerobaculia bacterium]|nr:methyltransferase domain-containing protein [Thermoanaerobaculia bacterium]